MIWVLHGTVTDNPQHDATSDEVSSVGLDGYADLTEQQTTATLALQTGQTIDEAADTADTKPTTVYQWLRGCSRGWGISKGEHE